MDINTIPQPLCRFNRFKNIKGVKLQSRFFSKKVETHITGIWKLGDEIAITLNCINIKGQS